MYVVIRRTKLSGSAEEAARRARDHIVPLVQGRPGFRGYCAFATEGGDAAFSISVFDDRDTALDAHRRVRHPAAPNLFMDLGDRADQFRSGKPASEREVPPGPIVTTDKYPESHALSGDLPSTALGGPQVPPVHRGIRPTHSPGRTADRLQVHDLAELVRPFELGA